MERPLVATAAAILAAVILWTVVHLRTGNFRGARIALAGTAASLALLFFFLILRGKAMQSCPLNTLPDAFAFLGWSTLLLAFATGLSFRMKLLGAFTSPLVLLLLLPSVFSATYPSLPKPRFLDPWVEFHAALSLVAYGAFGIAAVASALYLIQEYLLKAHRTFKSLFLLPPIGELSLANARMTDAGILCLTVSFFAGFFANIPISSFKLAASFLLWLLYLVVAILRYRQKSTPHAQAAQSLALFLFALLSLPLVHYLSSPPNSHLLP